MRNPVQRLFLPLLALSCMLPASGFACAIIPPERQAEVHAKHVAAFKAEVAAIKDEADLIFIGHLTKLSFSEETVTSPSGQAQVLRTHRAVFSAYDQIKGEYRDGQVLEYTTNQNRVVVGCGPAFRLLPKENGAGETYLVYAREGRIIRTNHIPTDTQTLTGYEEAALLHEGE